MIAAAAGLSPARLGASLWGAGLGFAAFAAVAWAGARVFKKEALGFGDVWLLAGIGAWLGAAAILPVVLLASLQGSLVGIALILLGKATPGPQGPPQGPSPSGRGHPESAESARGEGARPSETPGQPCPPGRGRPGSGEAGEGEGTPPSASATEADWVPPKNAVPFGPILAARLQTGMM